MEANGAMTEGPRSDVGTLAAYVLSVPVAAALCFAMLIGVATLLHGGSAGDALGAVAFSGLFALMHSLMCTPVFLVVTAAWLGVSRLHPMLDRSRWAIVALSIPLALPVSPWLTQVLGLGALGVEDQTRVTLVGALALAGPRVALASFGPGLFTTRWEWGGSTGTPGLLALIACILVVLVALVVVLFL